MIIYENSIEWDTRRLCGNEVFIDYKTRKHDVVETKKEYREKNGLFYELPEDAPHFNDLIRIINKKELNQLITRTLWGKSGIHSLFLIYSPNKISKKDLIEIARNYIKEHL